MISHYANRNQISKYLYALIHIFLVREHFSGESEVPWFDGKQI